MNFNRNVLVSLTAFTAGVILIASAVTWALYSFTDHLQLAYIGNDSLFARAGIRAFAFVDEMSLEIAALLFAVSAYFALRYISQTSHKGRRMVAIVFATLLGAYVFMSVIGRLLI